MIHKIQRLFVNTLTVHDNHYLFNRHNLTQPVQVKLSQKRKTFSKFSFAFLKSILNFKHLPKKDDAHSWSISGNRSSEKYGYKNVSKAVFQRTLRQKRRQIG